MASCSSAVRVHHPLQQGLRQVRNMLFFVLTFVRVHHPLQQGLRPNSRDSLSIWKNVRVHHPLQQGLRQMKGERSKKYTICTSASSITTRIKTP